MNPVPIARLRKSKVKGEKMPAETVSAATGGIFNSRISTKHGVVWRAPYDA